MDMSAAEQKRAASAQASRDSSSSSASLPVLNGSEILVRSLQAEGVEFIWGYPGGSVLYIYDALYKQESIQHVLVRHEQAAVHAADGYARATGNVGVALVTSGPGVTNAVTGIATAYMDSIPMVVITGQVPTAAIGLDAFQECDTVGITRMHEFISETAQYGALTRGDYIVDANTRAQMKKVLTEIQDGTFARQWIAEYAAGNANYKAMKQADLDHPIEEIGKKLRSNMKWLSTAPAAAAKPAADAQPQSEAA